MSEQPDPILATLREREAELLTEHALATQAVAVVNGRLDEVRDLIGAITRKRPARKPKAATEPARENGGDLLEAHHEPA
jgi:hypothetical protein